MISSNPDDYLLGQILRTLPAMVLRIDGEGGYELAEQSILERLTASEHNLPDDIPLAQTIGRELLSRIPDDIVLESIRSPVVFDIGIAPEPEISLYARMRVIPVTDDDGAGDGFVLFCYDITEQKQSDLALARKNSTLELLLTCTNSANNAADFNQALDDCLEKICSYKNWLYAGWLVGHAFMVDENDPDRLISSDIWYCKDRDSILPFIYLTRDTPLRKGVGVPGQVLETGQPIWHGKSSSYPTLPRAQVADDCGLVSVVAIPVIAGGRIVAILEFFADDERPPNKQLLDVLIAIGRELGSVHQRESSNLKLKQLADHDVLTGLVAMHVARDRIERAIAWSERNKVYAAVLFIDLDGFKLVNDQYGHHAGDELLRHVAAAITRNVRDVDTVARFGGDEFIVVLSGLDTPEGAGRVARNILDAINQPTTIAQHELQLSASIGIAMYRDNKSSVNELIKQADLAMYDAKHAGKNRYQIRD